MPKDTRGAALQVGDTIILVAKVEDITVVDALTDQGTVRVWFTHPQTGEKIHTPMSFESQHVRKVDA